MFFKIHDLKFFEKFTGKQLPLSWFFKSSPATLLKKELHDKCFSMNFAKFSDLLFFKERLRWLIAFVTSTADINFARKYLFFIEMHPEIRHFLGGHTHFIRLNWAKGYSDVAKKFLQELLDEYNIHIICNWYVHIWKMILTPSFLS